MPGRPVISNCGMPTEKVSKFLDNHLEPIMKNGLSYIRDSKLFRKNKNYWKSIEVVDLHSNIPHQAGLKALKEALKREILTRYLHKTW